METRASRQHHPDNFDQDTLVPLTVKFCVVNLLPSSQMELPVTNRHRDLLTKELSFQVGIAVVFSGSMMLVFIPILTVNSVKWSDLFYPLHDVVMQSMFEIVHVDRCGDVHRVDQHQTISNPALSNYAFDLACDAHDFVPVAGVHMNFFHVGGCLTRDELAHAGDSLVKPINLVKGNSRWQSRLYERVWMCRIMNKALAVVFTLVVFSTPAAAETYTIAGFATYDDRLPVTLQYVYVGCPQGEIDCYEFRGTSAITDAYGEYTLSMEVGEEHDGMELQLQLMGENFSHTVNLDAHRNSSSGHMTEHLHLQQTMASSGFFSGLGCCLLLFGLVFVSAVMRTVAGLASPQGRAAFRGQRLAKQYPCPDCGAMTAQHLLVRHLIFDHDYEPVDAGETAGSLMRKAWMDEE